MSSKKSNDSQMQNFIAANMGKDINQEALKVSLYFF